VALDRLPSPTVPQFFLEGEPPITPERMVAEYCRIGGITIEQLGIKPVLVATFFPQLTAALAQRSGATRSPHQLPGGFDRGLHVLDGAVSLATLPMGAPAAVMAAEELIACGVTTLLAIGAAGSLQPDLPIGSAVLPTTALREEGTSHHYLPPEQRAAADQGLVAVLRGAWRGDGELRAGLHWTTDAFYRSQQEKIASYRDAGVLSVDMEVSALYCLSQHRRMRCAAMLAISDELFEPWRVGFASPQFLTAMVAVGEAALDAGRSLAVAASS